MSDQKPVPNEDKPMPAMDAERTKHANLAPQGEMNLDDETPDSKYTPEGDHEQVPNIRPPQLIRLRTEYNSVLGFPQRQPHQQVILKEP